MLHRTTTTSSFPHVVARRGSGGVQPEAEIVIEHREELIFMICEAAELEHALMCEYLFAAFSMKERTDETLTNTQGEAVVRWRKVILGIAAEEMLHLALTSNMLTALGASPHLSRPNLPQPARHYPPGVVLALLPFGEMALRHFLYLERPEGMDLQDAEGMEATAEAAPLLDPDDIAPRLQDFATVGHLYRSIESGFRHLSDKLGEERLFVGPVSAQITGSNFSWPQLVAVSDLNSATTAIEAIVEQGEGPRGDWRNAHFGRFKRILEELQEERASDPAFEPARPVIAAPMRRGEGDEVGLVLEDPLTFKVADLFNVVYEVLLLALYRLLARIDESDAEVGILADVAVGLMYDAIEPVGKLLGTLPVGSGTGATAGAPFELFYQPDYLLPHHRAAWYLLSERLEAAAAFAERLVGDLEALGPVRDALKQHAQRLVMALPDS